MVDGQLWETITAASLRRARPAFTALVATLVARGVRSSEPFAAVARELRTLLGGDFAELAASTTGSRSP